MTDNPTPTVSPEGEVLARYEPGQRYIGSGEYVADMVAARDGEFVLYADAAATIRRLGGELDAAEQHVTILRAALATAHATAQLAASEMREKCVNICENYVMPMAWSNGHNMSTGERDAMDNAAGLLRDAIRALPLATPDLDAALDQARREGAERVAREAWQLICYTDVHMHYKNEREWLDALVPALPAPGQEWVGR